MTRAQGDAADTEEELRELMQAVTRDAKAAIREHDAEIMSVVRAMGGSANIEGNADVRSKPLWPRSTHLLG